MKKLLAALVPAALFAWLTIGVADAAPKPEATGTLTNDGATVTATFENVRKQDYVRLQAICQIENTGVVWTEAHTLTESPTTITFDIPEGLACRADLFVVPSNWKSASVTYLAPKVVLSEGDWQ